MLSNALKLSPLAGFLNTLANPVAIPEQHLQQPLDRASHTSLSHNAPGVSLPFFASLERMSRLVDITYCVGTTGIAPPFSCVSRCAEFPSLHLVETWNTGVLLSDSCGFVAVDHGARDRVPGSDMPHEPAIVVAFRGTYSIANTVVDLSTVPQAYVPYPAPDDGDDGEKDGGRRKKQAERCANCTAHAGFLASWRNTRELVLPALKAERAKHPDYPVHLVGHSLGGAVAALAALELRLSLGWENVRVTTFGEPRVGNAQLARYLDAAFGLDKVEGGDRAARERLPYRRVTHAGDPVPLLPLSEWSYHPHAGEVFIAKPDLQPAPEDLRLCRGDTDPACIHGAEDEDEEAQSGGGGLAGLVSRWIGGRETDGDVVAWTERFGGIPARLRLWQLLFAHRDYFWRLGLCVPGGDPSNWGRKYYDVEKEVGSGGEEL